ncbi:MAG TPA: hypothetical protein VHK86_00435, partial [Nitrososphaera sp.]|nr:hypothetical protein [Nitrososphaera sp.]
MIIGLILLASFQAAGLLFVVVRLQNTAHQDSERVLALAKEALASLLAKSLAEKAEVEAAKQVRDGQLAYLADQMAKSGKTKPKQAAPLM